MHKMSSYPSDVQWVDLLDSIQPEIQKYNLDFYKGQLTWGEYNQRRKDMTEKMIKEYRRIFPVAQSH